MSEKVVWLQASQFGVTPADRIGEILTLLNVIHSAELLAALPDCEHARAHHLAALSLLDCVARELVDLRTDLSK